MKIGNIDIKKAYFGTTPLTSSNAFIGEVPIIAGGPAPVTIDYFYLQPSQTADYSIDKKDLVYVKGDTFEFSKDKTNWRRFDSLGTSQVTRTLAAFMSANKDYGVLALSISAYNTYIVGQGLEVGCYNNTSPATGSSSHGAPATLITTDENYAYYMCQIGVVPTGSTSFRWFIQESGTTTYTKRSASKSISLGTPYMMTWDGNTTTSSGISIVDPGNYNVNVTSTEVTETIHLNANDKLYLRNTSGLGITSSTNTQTILIPSIQSNVNYNIGGILHTIYDYTVESFEDVVLPTYYANRLFYRDTHLVNAANLSLPVDELSNYCFYYMFNGCTALTAAPALPATALATYCYNYMFYGCSSLTAAPALPATALATYCYGNMFQNCTALVTAPALPATTLADSCYSGMFRGCTSLTAAPALPATVLKSSCYNGMFYDCTSLTTAPALPATTLASQCYQSMFRNCTALTTAPVLPATTLVSYCYRFMFQGCTLIDYIECMAIENINTNNCDTWLSGVAATGTFKKNIAAPNSGWTLDSASGIPSGWTVETTLLYVSRENIDASSGYRKYFVRVYKVGGYPRVSSDVDWITSSREYPSYMDNAYSIIVQENNTGEDRIGTLTFTLSGGTESKTVTIKQCRNTSNEMFTINAVENSTIGFGMNGSPAITPIFEYSLDGVNWLTWTYNVGSTIPLTAGQKVMIRGNNSSGINNNETNYSYFTITGNVTLSGNIMSLLDSTMSMTALPADNCFYSLFTGCTGITKAHELVLPLQTVRQAGYNRMFYQCTSLYNTPDFPATTVNGNGYIRMFEGCTAMYDAAQLTATSLGGGCYAHMFSGNTSLEYAPEITSSAIASDMFYNTFNGSSKLRYIKCMVQSQQGTSNWVNGVASSGLFVYKNGTSWTTGSYGIPSGWLSLAQ